MMTFLAIVSCIAMANILNWYVFGGREEAWVDELMKKSAAEAEAKANLQYCDACYVEANYRMNSPLYDPQSHGDYCTCDNCLEHTNWHTGD